MTRDRAGGTVRRGARSDLPVPADPAQTYEFGCVTARVWGIQARPLSCARFAPGAGSAATASRSGKVTNFSAAPTGQEYAMSDTSDICLWSGLGRCQAGGHTAMDTMNVVLPCQILTQRGRTVAEPQ